MRSVEWVVGAWYLGWMLMWRAWVVGAVVVSACAARPATIAAPPLPASEATTSAVPVSGGWLHGEVSVTDAGIVLRYYHDDPLGLVLTVEQGRLLRVDGDLVYFFDVERPVLRSVHMQRRGSTRVVLELLPIVHPAFPGADPLAYLWRQEDLSVSAGVLCVDLRPRRDGAAPIYNLRIELATATIAGRVVGPASPRLCTPAGPGGDGLSVPLRYPEAFTNVLPLTR